MGFFHLYGEELGVGPGILKHFERTLLKYGQPDVTADGRRPHKTVGV